MTKDKLKKYLKLAKRYNLGGIRGFRGSLHLESIVRGFLNKNKRLKKMYSKFLKEV